MKLYHGTSRLSYFRRAGFLKIFGALGRDNIRVELRMKLYHGTNGRWLKNILRVGIEPRHGHPRRNNWGHVKHQSNPRCVYLTNSYAPYFAMNAARGSDAECAVVEIDTDKLDEANLFPDEDFLEQVTRARDGQASGDMSTRTLFYRSRQFEFSGPCEIGGGGVSTWWEQSLSHLGTCSHRGTIPPSAITRACRWPHKPNALLRFIWDPSIVIMNQRIMGPQYVALTRKLFAGEFTDPRSVTLDDRMAAMVDPEKAILPPIKGWEIITP